MKTHSIQLLRILVITGLLTAISFAAFPTLKLEPVVLQQLFAPTNITAAPDGSGRVFICDQPGKIHILQNGMILPVPFLDMGSKMVTLTTNGSERGLLGMAFHPSFGDSASPGYRKFYLNYSARPETATNNPATPQNHVTVIAEYQASTSQPNLADPLGERIVLTYGQPQANHNGGQLEFGPDGLLYIASGDGGSANDNNEGHTGGALTPRPNGILGNGQDRRTLLGKILRINPIDPDGAGPLTYSIPPSNPFIGQTQDFTDNALDGPMRPEIYAYGLRNPWRFSFDKRPGGTNRLFCGDVGQGSVEEVNLINSGGNYGWRYREGSFVFDPLMATNGIAPAITTDPIAQYAHPGINIGTPALSQLGISITGGYVYRGSTIPDLQGKYLFADYSTLAGNNTARLMGLDEGSPSSFTLDSKIQITGGGLGNNPLTASILTFGEDASGEFLLGTKSNGGVLQLTSGGFPAGGIYQVVPSDFQPPPYQTWRTTFFPTLKTGQYLDPEGDGDGDGIGNEIEYAYGFSPLVANTSTQTGFSASRNSSDFTLTFRRDPAATDLVYNLQTSPDLVTWTTIATSTGGATATGVNGGNVLSDAAFPGQSAFRLVTVRDDSGPPGGTRFARLRTVR
jgi:glucose/arabinose dehydrogenase